MLRNDRLNNYWKLNKIPDIRNEFGSSGYGMKLPDLFGILLKVGRPGTKVMLILVVRHIHNTKSHYHYRYFSFQPVLHDWCNKGCGMCYPVCGMVHIKEPLLLIDKSSICSGSGFPFSLSEWSLTICMTPYNRK